MRNYAPMRIVSQKILGCPMKHPLVNCLCSTILLSLALTADIPALGQKTQIMQGLANPSSESEAGEGAESISPEEIFKYEEFLDLAKLLPEMEEVRVCGMDKVCMHKWEEGSLLIGKKGRLVRKDLDGDGVEEIAVILEKDLPTEAGAPTVATQHKAFLLEIASDTKEGKALRLHEYLVGVPNVLDMVFDESRGELVIDTGERITRTSHILDTDTGAIIASKNKGKPVVEKTLVFCRWNEKQAKFDIILPKKNKPA